MNEEERSEAARSLGRVRSERKTESGRENAAKARRARWADPAARERQAEAMREAAKRRWADPSARERQVQAIREAARRRKEAEQESS